METNNSGPPNPPSVEAAYKRKCIALKKRLNEIEAENETMRTRNDRGQRYIQKMRLESAMLLQRLSVLTGMAEEQGQTGSAAQPGGSAAPNEPEAGGTGTVGNEDGNGANNADAYMDDDTEGSSEDHHPPTPQERPLRVKRSRKSDVVGNDETQIVNERNNDPSSSNAHAGSHLLSVNDSRRPSLSQQEHLTTSFHVDNVSGHSTPIPTSPHDPPVSNNNTQSQQSTKHAVSPTPPNAAPSDTIAMDTDGNDNHPDSVTVKAE